MFTPPPPEPEPESQPTYALAMKLLNDGASPETVRKRLLKFGMSDSAISKMFLAIARAPSNPDQDGPSQAPSLEELEKNARKDAAQKQMFIGAVLCFGGLAVTIGTYLLAKEGGTGSYLVAWGAIIGGAFQLLRGSQANK
jgi:hypothetical protein